MGYLDLQLEKVNDRVPELIRLAGANCLWTKIRAVSNVVMIGEKNFRMPAILSVGARYGAWSSSGQTESLRGGAPTSREMVGTFIERMIASELSDRDMKILDGNNELAKKNMFQFMVQNLMNEWNMAFEAELFADGTPICFRSSGAPATVSGNTVYTGDTLTGSRFLRKGMEVTILDSTLTTLRGVTVVNEVDLMAKTFTCTGVIAGAAATDVVLYGRYTLGTLQGLYGLPFWGNDSSTGTTLGVNRATDSTIRATRVAAGGALSQANVLLLVHRQMVRAGSAAPVPMSEGIVPMHVQAEVFIGANSTQSLQRADVTNSAPGNVDRMPSTVYGQTFNWAGGRPHVVSPYQQNGRIDYPNWQGFVMAESLPMGFFGNNIPQSETNKRVHRLIGTNGLPTTVNWVAMTAGLQIFNINPREHGYITGLTVDASYQAF